MFSVNFPEPSLFQISELLLSIEIRKKFIKNTKPVLFESLGQNLQVLCCDLELKVFELWSRLNIKECVLYLYLMLYACVVAEI
jgi:hypothetical protein